MCMCVRTWSESTRKQTNRYDKTDKRVAVVLYRE